MSPRLTLQERRLQILSKMSELLLVKSPEEIKTAEIAYICGISEALLYKIFKDRKEMIEIAAKITLDQSWWQIPFQDWSNWFANLIAWARALDRQGVGHFFVLLFYCQEHFPNLAALLTQQQSTMQSELTLHLGRDSLRFFCQIQGTLVQWTLDLSMNLNEQLGVLLRSLERPQSKS